MYRPATYVLATRPFPPEVTPTDRKLIHHASTTDSSACSTQLCTCGPALLVTQDGGVSGQIRTTEGPAEFANVLLLAARDSGVVKSELADEQGRFTFTGLDSATYFMRTTGIGMSPTT